MIELKGLSEIVSKLDGFPPKLKAALAMDSQNISYNMEAWAKANATWTDRTGHARQFLQATVKWENSNKLMIKFKHSVHYGIYLELCNAGRYAILDKSIKQFAPQFANSWKQALLSAVK